MCKKIYIIKGVAALTAIQRSKRRKMQALSAPFFPSLLDRSRPQLGFSLQKSSGVVYFQTLVIDPRTSRLDAEVGYGAAPMLLVDCRNEIGFCFALGVGAISSELKRCFLVLSCLCVRQWNGSIINGRRLLGATILVSNKYLKINN